jgi:hypothetical protein
LFDQVNVKVNFQGITLKIVGFSPKMRFYKLNLNLKTKVLIIKLAVGESPSKVQQYTVN